MQRQAIARRRQGQRVALVPTMGYLHAGHMSLCLRARRAVGPKGLVVVSLFVNPTQFGPQEDLQSYPRDFSRDRKMCESAGVDVLFAPRTDGVYRGRKAGTYSTYIVEEALSQGMEGASRPSHFRGVATIVAKLFNLVLPEVAVFGAKDYQQAAVIHRMTANLDFPIRIVLAPTQRESDGLAMSSRNAYLSPTERKQAVCLHQAIQGARKEVAARPPGTLSARKLELTLKRQIENHPDAQVDYIEFFDTRTLRPVDKVARGTRLALAVKIGRTRLIDNASL